MWTNPIYSGDSKVIGFTATIDPALVPEITNVNLTSVIIDGTSDMPEIPNEPHEHIILCFGEYIKDENVIVIYWNSTKAQSPFMRVKPKASGQKSRTYPMRTPISMQLPRISKQSR